MEENYDSRQPTVRVTMVEGAQHKFQELFNLDASRATKRLDERKLPKSFWIPPINEQFSQTYNIDENLMCNNFFENSYIFHRKSNSSPSCFGKNSQSLTEAIEHNKQKSLDTNSKLNYLAKYCHNHQVLDDLTFNQSPPRSPAQIERTNNLTSPICDLPAEFQMAINEKNQVYFLNHQTKQTTWFDPRLSPHEQKWGMTLKELDKLHIAVGQRQKGKLSGRRSSKASTPSQSCGVCTPLLTVNTAPVDCNSLEGSICSPIHASPNNCIRMQGSISQSLHQNASTSQRTAHFSHQLGNVPNPSSDMTLINTALLPPHAELPVHIRHSKSASQPAPMSLDILNSRLEGCSRADYGALNNYNLGAAPSSSLNGLADNFTQCNNQVLTNSSSGHLIQDLEDLSLTNTGCTITDLNSQCQKPSHNTPLSLVDCVNGSSRVQAKRLLDTEVNSIITQINEFNHMSNLSTTGNHSHQSSMDSGVGLSVAGFANGCETQTHENNKPYCFDPNVENLDLNSDFIDGLPLVADWCQSINYIMPDQTTSKISTNVDLVRGQQS